MKKQKKELEERIHNILMAQFWDGSNSADTEKRTKRMIKIFEDEVKAERKRIADEWGAKIQEVKEKLDKEYGNEHNYIPNYEGIFDEILKIS